MPVCMYTFTCVEVEGKLKGVTCGTQTQVIRLGDRNLSHGVISMALMFSMCNGIYGLLKLRASTTAFCLSAMTGCSASVPKEGEIVLKLVRAIQFPWNVSLSPQRKKGSRVSFLTMPTIRGRYEQ